MANELDRAKAQFRNAALGMVRAIRREDEDPYPDEPYISMDDAAEVHAKLVASEPAADDVTNLDVDDFCGRIPENGLVAIPADLYARVAQTLTIPSQVRKDALEEAAKVAEGWMRNSALTGDCATQEAQETGRRIAQAIRNLSDKTPEAQEREE